MDMGASTSGIEPRPYSVDPIFAAWIYYKRAAEITCRRRDGNTAPYSYTYVYEQTQPYGRQHVANLLGWRRPTLHVSVPNPTLWMDNRLNPSQRNAVTQALIQPVTVVHGPPGTGKTSVIIELLQQIRQLDGVTTAVISSNNAAIQNIVDRSTGDLSNRIAQLGSSQKRKTFNGGHFRFQASRGFEKSIRASDFLDHFPIITSTLHSLFKCFVDGLDYQYDYVIVDEAGQVSLPLGMIAPLAARHLVLLGDPEQLPPVVPNERLKELESYGEPRLAHPALKVASDTSLLTAFDELLSRTPANCFLAEHYRCHPGIIEFSNREIYTPKQQPLTVRTDTSGFFTRDSALPIRVRWFNGDFGELTWLSQPTQNTEGRRSKRNLRQIEVFMHDEWPCLIELLKKTPSPTVAILTPYRAQLVELRKRLESDSSWQELRQAERFPELQMAQFSDTDSYNDEDGAHVSPTFPALTLTVHKAQGREFDIVYLLPVDDGDWEAPWSQKKRLINVAVTRAKQMLCVVTSTRLMSSSLQARLGGRTTLSRSRVAQPKEGEKYLQKLIDYAASYGEACNPDDFGLHSARLKSVFDSAPYSNSDASHGRPYGTEEVVYRALTNSLRLPRSEWIIKQQVPHRDIWFSGMWPNKIYDFVVFRLLSDSLKPILAIEVDGVYHRFNSVFLKYLGQQVDDLCESFEVGMYRGCALTSLQQADVDRHFQNNPIFTLLRLPTDGTTFHEFDHLADVSHTCHRCADRYTVEDIIYRQWELLRHQSDRIGF